MNAIVGRDSFRPFTMMAAHWRNEFRHTVVPLLPAE